MTLTGIRMSEFLIVCPNSATCKVIHYCVGCSSLRGKLVKQKMTKILFHRLQEKPSFTYCGVDVGLIYLGISLSAVNKRN